jgi:acyl-coenzyme A thioesterase PaaI-like protein
MSIPAVLPNALVERSAADVWDVTFDERWNVGRNQNGGVVLAMASTALAAAVDKPDPLSVTGHYLRAVAAGAGVVRASVVRAGSTTATGVAEVWQDDKERLRVIGTFGDHDARSAEADDVVELSAAPIPGPERCIDLFGILLESPAGPRALTRSLRNYEIRVAPKRGWGRDQRERPSLSGWIRLRDVDTITTDTLIAVADGFPPTLMSTTQIGWLPTLELTVHTLARPAADEPWLRAELRTQAVTGGLVEEEGELWDATGALVARFRQLALRLTGERHELKRQ